MSLGGAFQGINTALRGLLAHQAALDMTSHNLSNINTEGYSRQRVDIQTAPAIVLPSMGMINPGMVPTGVLVEGYERLRDNFIDTSMRATMSDVAMDEQMLAHLQNIEGILGEPNGGISTALNDFFAAMSDVANNPDDMSARTAFASSAQELATAFNRVGTDLDRLRNTIGDPLDASSRLSVAVTDINDYALQIASLNEDIRDAINSGQDPNDLLDRRDQMIDELSKIANLTVADYAGTNAGENAMKTVTIGAITVVDPSVAGPPAGVNNFLRADLDNAYAANTLTSGTAFSDERVYAMLDGTTAGTWMENFDDLVESIVVRINALNAAGFDAAGLGGGNIFSAAGITAATIALDGANNILTNPALIAASTVALQVGNGSNMMIMGAERYAVQGAPISATWENYFSTQLSIAGSEIQRYERDLAGREAALDALAARKASVSGVSMDEEMSNMLRFQHAYNAAARMLTALDDSLDTIINRMGKVGL